jgi:hypothetical protein
MRARTPSLVALALALCALAAWRLACVAAGPDIDTDAYAHHVIARAILADPCDLAVHWVWLPLFQYLQVPLVALGGTMREVRWANVALAAALPAILYAYVKRTARAGGAGSAPEATALLAAAFAGGCPIAMQMGTTAQPEPLFAVLMLGVAIAFQKARYGAAALLLGAAVILRYEAWAVLAAVAALFAIGVVRRRGGEPAGAVSPWRAWPVVAVPVALIFLWALLRRPVDGRWFGFLGQTHEFANDALQAKRELRRGVLELGEDALYYPLAVPLRVFGPVMALVPFGVARTVRQQGVRFVILFGACLGFVALSWITRSSLKLDRHFVAVVPLYATFAAQGAAVIADGCAHVARRFARADVAARFGRGFAGLLALVALGVLATQLTKWMGDLRGSIERGWPERAALGAFVRSLPEGSMIFCDDATLEIASGVDRRRFDRHWSEDPQTWQLVRESARERGVAFVATWRNRLRGHDEGEVVFQAGIDPREPDATGVGVMRVPADGRGRWR